MYPVDDLHRTVTERIGPTVADFSAAIGKCRQTVRSYADAGMPCVYVGRTRHVVLPDALDWILNRGRMPTRAGRPKRVRTEQTESTIA
jgi:hypothetical protein